MSDTTHFSDMGIWPITAKVDSWHEDPHQANSVARERHRVWPPSHTHFGGALRDD